MGSTLYDCLITQYLLFNFLFYYHFLFTHKKNVNEQPRYSLFLSLIIILSPLLLIEKQFRIFSFLFNNVICLLNNPFFSFILIFFLIVFSSILDFYLQIKITFFTYFNWFCEGIRTYPELNSSHYEYIFLIIKPFLSIFNIYSLI